MKSQTKSSKLRRESGRIHIYVDDENYPFQETYWDDWIEYRDGFRNKKKDKPKTKNKFKNKKFIKYVSCLKRHNK